MVQALLSFKKKRKTGHSLKIICLLFFLTLHTTSAGLAGEFTFENEHPLTQISLAIGNYKLQKIEADASIHVDKVQACPPE